MFHDKDVDIMEILLFSFDSIFINSEHWTKVSNFSDYIAKANADSLYFELNWT